MRTAAAKGLSFRTILFKHGLKNALIPVVTVIALSLPGLIARRDLHRDDLRVAGHGTALLQRAHAERPRAADGLSALGRVPRRLFELVRRRRLRVARSAREVRLRSRTMAAPSLPLAPAPSSKTSCSLSKVTFWTRLRRHKLADRRHRRAGADGARGDLCEAALAVRSELPSTTVRRRAALERYSAAAVLSRQGAVLGPLAGDRRGRSRPAFAAALRRAHLADRRSLRRASWRC